MNLELSLAEVLERVIPGAVFLTVAALLLQPDLKDYVDENGKLLLSIVAVCFSYGIGTLFNIVGSVPIFDNREYWSRGGANVEAIKAAVKDRLGIEPSNDSWKLCYGICHKNNYAVRSEIFGRLNVFCRSMATCCFFTCLLALFLVGTKCFISSGVIAIVASSIVIGLVFWRGARIYSRAFVGSIYEGFYSYHIESKRTEPS